MELKHIIRTPKKIKEQKEITKTNMERNQRWKNLFDGLSDLGPDSIAGEKSGADQIGGGIG